MVRLYNMLLDSNKHPLMVQEQEYDYSANNLNNPEAIVKMANTCFRLDKRAEEHVLMLALDSKCNLLGLFEVAHGAVNKSLVSPREVYLRALCCGAVNIVVLHNHPSGDTTPSRDDNSVAQQLKLAGNELCVKLLDFIIVGQNNYYSYKEKNCL